MRQLRKGSFKDQVIKFPYDSWKLLNDQADAVAECFRLMRDWEEPNLTAQLGIKADLVTMGNHVHHGTDNPFITTTSGEVFMYSDAIRNSNISGLGLPTRRGIENTFISSISGGVVSISGEVHRECPPNKVVKYTQLVWNIAKSTRDNLADMVVNDYYRISGKSVVQLLENATPERFELEIWFEDDRKFHIYRDDKRIFESKSAKETAAFIEGGLK
ncbi:hypothetical protein Aci022_078 [Acinetobacter phage vB_AbaM_B09_Aci02-2]|uniref:Uncharacterized protein n=1 Tax=Acinetobacter phage vB_AbaM_B09_Aci02-2 TaxID=2315467 RepID=A0A386KMK9_9CAUD|nr:hypothetical protein HOU30_gp112 [Acinetobacter phage vB_AbaM_B09_Aci02-2]AYD85723.1 hypothetical protein Aci022_078 [Acinetobacter phage vB_AbaM_B09_Aci02-2]